MFAEEKFIECAINKVKKGIKISEAEYNHYIQSLRDLKNPHPRKMQNKKTDKNKILHIVSPYKVYVKLLEFYRRSFFVFRRELLHIVDKVFIVQHLNIKW